MKVGIQLYSVRQSMAINPIETIRKVVKAGYRNIEVANHDAENDAGVGFGVSVGDMKKLLEETNSKIVSAHVFPLIPEKLDAILEYHKEIGTKYIAMPMDFYKDREEILRKAEILNKLGERCKEAGIQFVYHNHYHEFQIFGGESAFEMLMNGTDENLVKIELDTYWTMRAGKNPVDILKQYKNRVCLIHQKDYTKGYEDTVDLLSKVGEGEYIDMDAFGKNLDEKTFTEIGTGIMDIQSIIDVGNDVCGVDYIILEQDYTQLPTEQESIEKSMESFKRFKGIEW